MVTVCQHPECKKSFEAKRSTRKYCSDACKMAASRLRNKAKVKTKCLYCGKPITQGGRGRPAKFCRDSHKITYHRNLKHHIWRAMTKGSRAFGDYRYNDYTAWEAVEQKGTAFWKEYIEQSGYTFTGRYFIDTTSQGVLL